ncbi:hypothetical protein [Arthrobacter sp. MI7-26]|uniref:hypothetical protein n=1 Tax=Arthrobacter sp. MI7-26 TaxID=2993653 RepID=UPI002248EDED|nr:hypothetical protein [Arthrobacter sp. MI7-26]
MAWKNCPAGRNLEEAHEAHGRSAEVAAFEAVYQPVLTAGPVVFTDYAMIASNI